MLRRIFVFAISLSIVLIALSCTSKEGKKMKFTGAKGEVILMTLDPGHFHASLVQKTMYEQISPTVYVYAPEGPDVQDHLKRIEGFNNRKENPTHWKEIVYTGPDYLERMLKEKPGNVMVTAGNNRKKTVYIKAAVDASINVLADKPMCINKDGFELLKQAFASAEKNGVLLYDIMTERSEITNTLQKELINMPEVFGELTKGTPEDPAVITESVHHFFKYVAGNPIKRPAWYFDTDQEGEGIVDVTTHLVDLVQWECFPEQIIDYKNDIQMLKAKHWPTIITKEQFSKVTRLPDFPDYLKKKLDSDGNLPVYCNGEMTYSLKGVNTRVSVIWRYEAATKTGGTGDTHYSIIKGTKANVIIRQGEEQKFIPELYVEPAKGVSKKDVGAALTKAIETLQAKYPGIGMQKIARGWWITIPDKYRVGHEAHFADVTERYLKYLVDGKLPDWEVPNMIAKYYTTTSALELALKEK